MLYMSTMTYFTNQHTGTIVPLRTLEDLDTTKKDDVAAIFGRPDQYIIDSLKRFLEGTTSQKLSEKATDLLQAARGAVLPPTNPGFWSSPENAAIYGSQSSIYLMMHMTRKEKRQETDKQSRMNKTQEQKDRRNEYRRGWRAEKKKRKEEAEAARLKEKHDQYLAKRSKQKSLKMIFFKMIYMLPLARQKYWQITTNFTTLPLYNCNLKLAPKDYK